MEFIEQPKLIIKEYSPFYAQLAKLEQENASIVFDYESKQGNKEARSHVTFLRHSNGDLERVRKKVKEESLLRGRAIDAEAKKIAARIQAMIQVHQVKLDEIAQRETNRINKHKEKLVNMQGLSLEEGPLTAALCKQRLTELEAIQIDDSWEEFITEAAKIKDSTILWHRNMLQHKEHEEAQAIYLEQLKKEAAERVQKDRDEAIAKAAVERAQRAAQELAEQEAKKAQQAILAAEARAKQEREDAERRELQLKLQAETAERRRVEAEQQAQAQASQAALMAEQQRLHAIQDERDRVAAIASAEEKSRLAREANKAHQRKINLGAVEALVSWKVPKDLAKIVITLIASHKIPGVQINY